MADREPWRDVVKICDNFEYMVRPDAFPGPRGDPTLARTSDDRRPPTRGEQTEEGLREMGLISAANDE